MNSKRKGVAGELEWAHWLQDHGIVARRGQQFSGSPDSPDVVSDLPMHCEVKRVEHLNIEKAMAQAVADSNGQMPYVAHRKNGTDWLITMRAEDWFVLVSFKNSRERSKIDETSLQMNPYVRAMNPLPRQDS